MWNYMSDIYIEIYRQILLELYDPNIPELDPI